MSKTNEIIDRELALWKIAYSKSKGIASIIEKFANKIKLELELQNKSCSCPVETFCNEEKNG